MSDEKVSIAGNIDELSLSARVRNALSGRNPWEWVQNEWKKKNLKKIITIKDLVSLTPGYLLEYPDFGKVGLKEVRDELARHGLYLGMNLTAEPTPQDILKDLTLEEIKSLMPHLDFGAPVITQMSKDPEMARMMQRIKMRIINCLENAVLILIGTIVGVLIFGIFMVVTTCMLKLLFITYQWLGF